MAEAARTHAPSTGSAAPAESAEVLRFLKLARQGEAGGNPYAALLGLNAFDTRDLVRAVERGVAFSSLLRLQKAVELSLRDLSDVVGIPSRTLDRRRKEGRLQADESDRVLRLSRIFGATVALFEGDAGAARRWLAKPQEALGAERPIDLVRTEVGALEVERLLGRLEHGVVS